MPEKQTHLIYTPFLMFALIPIGDDNRSISTLPFVTYALIAINIIVFFVLQRGNPAFTYGFAAIPQEITRGIDLIQPAMTPMGRIPQAPGPSPIYLTLFTAMFMHGSISHLLGNMLFLWIFGDNVEDAMGHVKFVLFYLLCGLAAAFAQIAASPDSVIPTLGASGAIAGVLGSYLLMFPRKRVRVIIGWFGIVALPAFVVVGGWIFIQMMNGMGQLSAVTQEDVGGVAYLAHVGGAIAGLILTPLFRRHRVR